MVRSKLAAAILSASFALPGVASALGIGEYTLKSYLNQPLELEIDLVQTKDLSTEEVIAALGSQEDFSRAGVERLFALTDIRFEIRQRADGGLVVVARTSKPVTEPFLNFLMEVQWPQGRMLREYTILLDPPIYRAAGASATATAAPETQAPAAEAAPEAEPAPAVVQAPVAAPAAEQVYVPAGVDSSLPPPPAAARQGAGSRPLPTPAAQPAPVATSAGAGEYQVQASDTMWEIAARNRAGSASVQQTMMAIQRANPDAFIRGNVNLVKKGYVLRIPSEAEAQEVSTAAASSQFAEQTRAWRELLDQRQAALPTDSAQLQAGGSSRPSAPAAKGTGAGEVTLVAPTASGGTKASGGKETAALQNQLAIAEEGLDKAARENKELASRLADLDKQVKGSDKLLAMKNDEIAGLQDELNRLRKEKGLAPAEPAKPVAEEPAPTEPAAVPAEQEPAPAVAAAEKPKSDKPKEKPAKSAKKDEEGSSMLMPVVGVLALLGIGGAGFWFWRRKQAAAPKVQPEFTEEEGEAHDAQIADDLAQLQDLNLGGGDEEQGAPAAAAESETADPLGEADMYMAYGRFQQAADILYAALQREPDRGDLRVKLAEVYAEMGDNDAAREQASQAAQTGASDIRSQANALLARLGGGAAPAAAAAAAPAAAEESLPSLDDLALEFSGGADQDGGDLDFSPAETLRSPAVSAPAPAAAAAEEESLDFSLDDISLPSDDDSSAQASVSQTAVRPKQDLDELSLDDGGLGEFSLDDEVPAAAGGDELSLDDFSLDDNASAAAPGADELSLDSDIDFAGSADAEVMTDLPSLEEESLPVEPEAVTAVQPALNVDLESELADLQSDLSGEGVGAAEDSKGGDDFDFLADSDENATKLDLAKAYIDMGDAEGARDILNEVVADGSDAQKSEARKLLEQVG